MTVVMVQVRRKGGLAYTSVGAVRWPGAGRGMVRGLGCGGGRFYESTGLLGRLGFGLIDTKQQLDVWVVDNISENDGVWRWEFSEYQGRMRITTDGQRRGRLQRKLKRGQRGLVGVCCSGD